MIVPHCALVCQLLGDSYMIFGPISRASSFVISLLRFYITKYLLKITSFNFSKDPIRVQLMRPLLELFSKCPCEIGFYSPVWNLFMLRKEWVMIQKSWEALNKKILTAFLGLSVLSSSESSSESLSSSLSDSSYVCIGDNGFSSAFFGGTLLAGSIICFKALVFKAEFCVLEGEGFGSDDLGWKELKGGTEDVAL